MGMGLEGVVAAETRLSRVDGEAGRLIVAAHNIEELAAEWRLTDVAALLWRDFDSDLGDGAVVARHLARGRRLAFERVPRLLDLTEGASVVEALRTGWSLLCDDDPARHDIPAPALLTAAAPVFVAAHWRHTQGEAPLPPSDERDHAADMLAMLGLPAETAPARALERYLITIATHPDRPPRYQCRILRLMGFGPGLSHPRPPRRRDEGDRR